MTASERVKEYLDEKKIDYSEFARSIGVSPGYVNAMDKGFGPKFEPVVRSLYPDLNLAWVRTGEGEMLRPPQMVGDVSNSTVVGANVSGNGNTISHNDLADMIRLQLGYQDLLKKKDEQIDRLLSLLEKK